MFKKKRVKIDRSKPDTNVRIERFTFIENGQLWVGFRRRPKIFPLRIDLLVTNGSLVFASENNWLKRLIRSLPFSARNSRQFARCV